jgi:hypothetical protein
MMLLLVVAWLSVCRVRGIERTPPWAGYTLIGALFLVDVTATRSTCTTRPGGGTMRITVSTGACSASARGSLIERGGVRPRWALAVLITGLGSLLAIL